MGPSQQSEYDRSLPSPPLTSILKEPTTKLASPQSNKIIPRRRAAIVSHKVQYLYQGDFIESKKKAKRRVNRRYAITRYSKISENRNLSCLGKQAYVDGGSRIIYLEDDISNDDQIFVLDENDNLDFNMKSSQFLTSLIILYHGDSFAVRSSDTHRRIIRAIIFSDLKAKGYKFLKRSLLQPGKLFVLDDVHSRMIIKKQLMLQGTRKKF